MNKKTFYLIIFLLLFLNMSAFASMSSGYVIRLNNFSLTIQFYINDYESLRTTEQYLIKSDEALWDVLTWVHNNKNALQNKNTHIRLNISYSNRKINYWGLMGEEISEGINREDAENAIRIYGQYNSGEDFAEKVGRIVSTLLRIPYISPDRNIEIPIYLISTKTFGSEIPAQFENSHIFRGTMQGQMINYAKNMRFIVFWDIASAQTYVDEYITSEYTPEYTFEQIILSKNTIFEIFDTIY